MRDLALACVAAASLWLVAVALLMALRPSTCLRLFAHLTAKLQSSSWRVQITEQSLRILAGAAFVVRAPVSKAPTILAVVGWLLIVTSVVILLAPISWHGKYGAFWTQRLTPTAIRLFSPIPALVGSGLLYAAI